MHVRRTPTTRASPRSRRLLTGALVVTALVAALGATGSVGLEPVRGAAATVLGPLERLLGPGADEASAARAEAAALAGRHLPGLRIDALREIPRLLRSTPSPLRAPAGWDGRAGDRIASIMAESLGASGEATPAAVAAAI